MLVMLASGETRVPVSPAGYAGIRFRILLFWLLVLELVALRYLKSAYGSFAFLSFGLINALLLVVVVNANMRRPLPGWLVPRSAYAGAVTMLIALFVNAYAFGVNVRFLSAVSALLLPLTLVIFVIDTIRRASNEQRARFIRSITIFLNVYFVLNSIVVYLQIKTRTFLMTPFFGVNPYVEDHMAGSIGLNGVTTLNFVWLATFFANVEWGRRSRTVAPWVLVALQLAAASYISLLNDNKMFMLTLLASLLLYGVARAATSGTRKGARLVLGGIAVVVIAVVVLPRFGITSTESQLDESASIADIVIYDYETLPDVDNERALINYRAYSEFDAGRFGAGIANIDVEVGKRMVHRHFGINSAAVLLVAGGWLYLAGACLLYAGYFVHILCPSTRPRAWMIAGVALFFLMGAYAAPIFLDQYLVVALLLLFLAIGGSAVMNSTAAGLATSNERPSFDRDTP
ncbi:hypothetical protein [Nocardioides sp. zg-1230]|uniref:hypothetical protein n=1 Tax=Nocardioides sp. zg-1230 TaxID=2736601 RepID=UPI001557A5C0|nr:hypothetical protein [Nocardioides sp. zg-1230]NPC41217.1 hypothetical protein [Nocardioides sp. zg-1230]